MKTSNQKGISIISIILFGTLVLAVVLANGIIFNVNEEKRAKAINALETGKTKAVSYCGSFHELLNKDCQIVTVYKCGQKYILRSNCFNEGDIILDYNGDFIRLCYFETEDSSSACYYYWLDEAGRDCTLTNNLCP